MGKGRQADLGEGDMGWQGQQGHTSMFLLRGCLGPRPWGGEFVRAQLQMSTGPAQRPAPAAPVPATASRPSHCRLPLPLLLPEAHRVQELDLDVTLCQPLSTFVLRHLLIYAPAVVGCNAAGPKPSRSVCGALCNVLLSLGREVYFSMCT